MPEHTYVLVEVEDSCLAGAQIIGGGDVTVIEIDWDEICNDLAEAEDKLGEVVSAIDDLKVQGRKDTGDLEKIARRLEDTIDDIAVTERDFDEMQKDGVNTDPDGTEDEKLCSDCGRQVDGCVCDDNDEDYDLIPGDREPGIFDDSPEAKPGDVAQGLCLNDVSSKNYDEDGVTAKLKQLSQGFRDMMLPATTAGGGAGQPKGKTMVSMPGHNNVKGTKAFPVSGHNPATAGDLIEFLKNAIDKGMPLNTPLEFGCERDHKGDRADFERLNPRIDQIEWFVHEDIPAGQYDRDWLTILMAFDRRSEND